MKAVFLNGLIYGKPQLLIASTGPLWKGRPLGLSNKNYILDCSLEV